MTEKYNGFTNQWTISNSHFGPMLPQAPLPPLSLHHLNFFCEDSITLEEMSIAFGLIAKYCSARAEAVRLRRSRLYIEANEAESLAHYYYTQLPPDWRW
jgi:hypothetical protein